LYLLLFEHPHYHLNSAKYHYIKGSSRCVRRTCLCISESLTGKGTGIVANRLKTAFYS